MACINLSDFIAVETSIIESNKKENATILSKVVQNLLSWDKSQTLTGKDKEQIVITLTLTLQHSWLFVLSEVSYIADTLNDGDSHLSLSSS